MSSITKKELFDIALSCDPDQGDTQYMGNVEITISPDLNAEITMSATATDGWQLQYVAPVAPIQYGRGQYVTTDGQTFNFDGVESLPILQMLAAGEIMYLTIETWFENE